MENDTQQARLRRDRLGRSFSLPGGKVGTKIGRRGADEWRSLSEVIPVLHRTHLVKY